jgi:hypothetical protein
MLDTPNGLHAAVQTESHLETTSQPTLWREMLVTYLYVGVINNSHEFQQQGIQRMGQQPKEWAVI